MKVNGRILAGASALALGMGAAGAGDVQKKFGAPTRG